MMSPSIPYCLDPFRSEMPEASLVTGAVDAAGALEAGKVVKSWSKWSIDSGWLVLAVEQSPPKRELIAKGHL